MGYTAGIIGDKVRNAAMVVSMPRCRVIGTGDGMRKGARRKMATIIERYFHYYFRMRQFFCPRLKQHTRALDMLSRVVGKALARAREALRRL